MSSQFILIKCCIMNKKNLTNCFSYTQDTIFILKFQYAVKIYVRRQIEVQSKRKTRPIV